MSPARDLTVAKAAIQAGADAVYIGAPRFGAREAAGNSLEDLAELVAYAHAFGVQVLVTLNTLLRPDEYDDAFRLAAQLHALQVDALIIQDLQFAELLFTHLPDTRLHASTQCDNRTPEQVARLRDMGFKRVVLARELSIDEIAAIHRAVPDIELEAFVHGALCVSYSGRCYMSEVLLGRSANRGCCAQMCRMRYDLLDADGKEITDDNGQPVHQRYVLSLQDMDRSAYLQELIEAGVTTFKIEGRLKDAAYVTNITAYYREKLSALSHQPSSACQPAFIPNPAKTFHRGATDYFLHGRTRPMANWQTPKSTGEYIGTIVETRDFNSLVLKLAKGVTLQNGDGLCVGEQGFYVNAIRPLPDGTVEIQTNTQRPTTNNPQVFSDQRLTPNLVYRNHDTAFLKSLSSSRRVPVTVLFEQTKRGYRLTYRPIDKRLKAQVADFDMPHEPATNQEKALSTIRMQLTKLGDSVYTAQSFEYKGDSVPFLPISTLNAMRRQLTTIQPQAISYQPAAISYRPIQDTTNGNTDNILMTCRYCLLYEMGHCRKTNPLKNEPKFLRLANGTLVTLRFDCARCEMQICKK